MSETRPGIMTEIERGNRSRAPEDKISQSIVERPRTVSAGHGWSWFVDGYRLVQPNLGIWVVVILLLFAINILIGLMPVVSLLAYALWPVFTGGLMLGCRSQDHGRDMTVGHLFAGFQRHAGKLFALGGLYLLGILAIALAGMIFGTGMLGANVALEQSGGLNAPMLSLSVLFAVALVILFVTLFWFAPALVVLHDVGVFEAMKLSFVGSWRNVLPFLVYGVIGLLLTIAAIVPVGLGLLILFPVFWGAMYVGYKEIFLESAAA
jgi:uncharacterized membrane protein